MINQADVLRGHMEHIGGCGDGGCIVHVRPGMHTNGGCRCNRDPHKMSQVVHWHKRAVAEQAAQIKRLREALTDMVALFSADDLLTERGALIPVGHALKAARAALQPKEGEK